MPLLCLKNDEVVMSDGKESSHISQKCAFHDDFKQGVTDAIKGIESGLRSVQALVTDTALIKQDVSVLKNKQDEMSQAFFGKPGVGHSFPDRLGRVEDAIKYGTDQNLPARVDVLENTVVKESDLKVYHDSVLSGSWKIVAPIIIAFVCSIVGASIGLWTKAESVKALQVQVEEMKSDLDKANKMLVDLKTSTVTTTPQIPSTGISPKP